MRVWYKYAIRNPYPAKELRYVTFVDVGVNNSPRNADALQLWKNETTIPALATHARVKCPLSRLQKSISSQKSADE